MSNDLLIRNVRPFGRDAADRPNATPFELHIFAAMAEEEARQISARTRAALAAAKRRGVKLGNPQPEKAAKARTRIANEFALTVYPIINELQQSGLITFRALASGLEARGVLTPRGNTKWTPTAVSNLVRRIEA